MVILNNQTSIAVL